MQIRLLRDRENQDCYETVNQDCYETVNQDCYETVKIGTATKDAKGCSNQPSLNWNWNIATNSEHRKIYINKYNQINKRSTVVV